jgi:hypothetical protein
MKLFLKAPPPVQNGIDPAFFNQVAQFAHFGTMFTIAITVTIFAGTLGLIAVGILEFVYAALHEFVWDPREENSATRGSDLEDFAFLMLGYAMSCVVWYLAKHFGRLM